MAVVKNILTGLLVLVEIFLIGVVLLQSGRKAGLSGAIAGGAETFFGKNKARSFEGKLQRWTKVSAVLFIVIALVLVILE
ncbi:preprotein translocase subunit SecG [Caldicoprobacter guelmensis]|uniref:preprotein translocase subunit SecG n=1 Tax=Caldicoprobacter guelmensis TaxID=1170224 RepID=UPI00195BDB99|nr:preprotein translocase subunit SecG [Caldicoprobacter guelmensis]MBM7582684.1 preprotein translocase subunit SecG [Caldicoprobacter guelmensis]